ncbi:MAG: hypothetical protein ACYDC6_11855, partial [Acidobacteriaceae bacterium]
MTKPGHPQSVETCNSQKLFLRKIPWIARLASHIPPGQFLRYLMVGGWNTLFGYSTYALLTALLMPRVRFGYVLA